MLTTESHPTDGSGGSPSERTTPQRAASSSSATCGGSEEAAAALSTFFDHMKAYVTSETEVQAEEWRFMERCNAALRARYAKLRQQADVVVHAVSESQTVLARLPEFYGKVDELTRSLDALESVAAGLDTYSSVLEDMYVIEPAFNQTATAATGSKDDEIPTTALQQVL